MAPAAQLVQQGLQTSQDAPARQAWPLDLVTDHSEWMGVMHQFDDPNSAVRKTVFGQTPLQQ